LGLEKWEGNSNEGLRTRGGIVALLLTLDPGLGIDVVGIASYIEFGSNMVVEQFPFFLLSVPAVPGKRELEG